uniref:Uncharacterized protein n=1 Tax=Meloidogyne enterolobii TaxID=390850 RepID=A0A6V7W9C7_MELEN|nr:unnamed protein product [Meloidogyne enterolobii]
MKDDEKEKLDLPKIPKRQLPLKEDVFYHSPVIVHAPKKTEDKAMIILKSKRAKLMEQQTKKTKKEFDRGSHHREVGHLFRIRSLANDCIDLMPKTGCRTVNDRASYYTKLEMIQENLNYVIQNAARWDEENSAMLCSSSNS